MNQPRLHTHKKVVNFKSAHNQNERQLFAQPTVHRVTQIRSGQARRYQWGSTAPGMYPFYPVICINPLSEGSYFSMHVIDRQSESIIILADCRRNDTPGKCATTTCRPIVTTGRYSTITCRSLVEASGFPLDIQRKLAFVYPPHWPQTVCPCGFSCLSGASVPDKRFPPSQEKSKQNKEISTPRGCVLCGGFKGPAATLPAGDLRAPVNVRGTLTKSSQRPRRRSQWGSHPARNPKPQPKQKAARGSLPQADIHLLSYSQSTVQLHQSVTD